MNDQFIYVKTPARCEKNLEVLRTAENCTPTSDVQYPLTLMYEFAHLLRSTDNMVSDPLGSGYHIYSVHFDSISTTSEATPGMYSVRMHCGYKRFEEFLKRYDATIIDMSFHTDLVHVVAQVKDNVLGWLEVSCVYYRQYLRRTEDSVFEEIDSMHDLFMIHTILNDWKVAEGLEYHGLDEEQ